MKKFDLRKLIKEAIVLELEEQKLKEGFGNWLSGVARNLVHGIIDRRAGYLTQALKYDPKLQRLAKDLKITNNDFEKRIYTLMDKDPDFLRALASGSLKASSSSRF